MVKALFICQQFRIIKEPMKTTQVQTLEVWEHTQTLIIVYPLEKSHIETAQKINEKTAKALKHKFGEGYKGILYGGFIATNAGVELIEYNARFGDPEAMNVLSILNSDLIKICEAIISEDLNNTKIVFKNLATVCKYAVPKGIQMIQ